MIDISNLKPRTIDKLNLYEQNEYTLTDTYHLNETIIPRVLYFIWFGSELPRWAKYAIEAYRKMNPGFNIKVYNEIDINNTTNQDIIECWNEINNPGSKLSTQYYKKFSTQYLSNSPYVRFSDSFRFFLLNKYGGIYLDCDTFPIKSFDDELMNNKFFMTKRLGGQTDIYFIGSIPGQAYNMFALDEEGNEHGSPEVKHAQMTDAEIYEVLGGNFKLMRDKFFNCKLQIGEHYNDPDYAYIDHFVKRSWLNK